MTQRQPHAMRIGLTTAAMLLVAVTCVLGAPRAADAANATWSGANDALWATLGNWGAAASVPGAGETATFNATSSNTTVDISTGLNVGSVVFDTASAAAYTIGSGNAGSQTLTLGTGVTMNVGVTANQLFNANILLGTATVGTYTFTNSSTTNTLTFAGTVLGGSGGTAGAKTLNISGAGRTTFTNTLGAGGGTGLNFANTGTGTVTLSGAVSSSLSTLRATGANGWLVVDGPTLTVTSSSAYANSKFDLRSGSVAFSSAMTFFSSSDGGLCRVTSGTFSAASVSMARTWGDSTATATTSAPSTSGFVVTSGTASVTGILDLAGSNSNASGLVSGGSLTVGGEVRVGNSSSATGRWFVFQVSGGRFASTDAVNGIVLARNSTNANNSSLLLTGGTTTAEKISFGIATTASNSAGVVTLNGSSAALYLGSGGIVKSATNPYTSTITLTSGLLGAKAGWSSSLSMNLNGSGAAVTFRAADAAGTANDIAISGSLSGAGGFAKTGDGTLTLSGANSFTGAMAVTAGTLAVGNATALGSGTNSLTVEGGTVNLGGYAVSIGQLAGGGGTISSSVAGASLATAVATSSTFAGTLGDGAGTLAFTKSGVGTLTLTGSQSYTGSTTISAGTLAFAAAVDQTLTGAITGAGGLTQAGSGRLALAAANSYTGLTTVSAGTLALAGDGALASTGTVSLTGSTAVFDISSASGNRSASLLTGSAGSSLLLGSNGFTMGNATNATFAGQVVGSGVLTKVGAGTLTLSGSNTGFTGGAVLAGGTVALGGNANTGIGTGPVTFQGGALSSNAAGGADPGGGGNGFTNNFIVPAGQVGTLNLAFRGTISGSLTGSGTFNVNVHGTRDDFSGNWSGFAGQLNIGTMTGSGDFRVNTGAGFGSAAVNLAAGVFMSQIFNPPSSGSLETVQAIGELSGAGVLGGNPVSGRFVNWSVGGLNTSSTFAGRITNSTGAARLTKVGSGTLTLSGSNSYTGSTTVSAGVLRIGDGGTVGLLGATTIAVSNGAVLAFNRSDDYGGAFSNVISGSGGVRVDAGFLTLSASNTYTGLTDVLAGSTLAVNGRLANSALNVAAGATLMGSGTIAGLTTVAGIHSPGNSPGIETFANLTYSNGATVNWELWGNTASNSPLAYDQIMVTGSLSFAGPTALNLVFTGSSGPTSTSSVDWTNAFWDAGQEWLAFSVSGTTTGFSNLSLSTADWLDANGAAFQTARPTSTFSIEQRGSNAYVVYAIVPEPASAVIAAIGGVCLAWAAHRSRRAARERRG